LSFYQKAYDPMVINGYHFDDNQPYKLALYAEKEKKSNKQTKRGQHVTEF